MYIREHSVSHDIAAPAEVVYAAITDVTRMGEWSPECYRCEWADGATEAAVGVMFDGHNRNGENEWSTQGRIVELVPNEKFVFHAVWGDFHFATWGYEIEATDTGCTVTQHWEDLRPDNVIEGSASISGVADRAEFNKQQMATTLERLAAALEG